MGHAPEPSASAYSLDSEAARTEPSPNISQEILHEPPKTWRSAVWDTWELPKDQRWLMFKLDAFVLTFASLGYFLKNLDQTNVNNAFLSGMQEDLSMYKNELVTSTSIWTVGYVIGQIPSNLLLTRVSPRWVIPTLEVGWGIATICTSRVESYQALYALRFLAAAYTNLNGVHGHAGWRWLFIIDGIITLPLAVLGYVFFPNLPQGDKKTWWTSDAEHEISKQRMKSIGRAGKQPWTTGKAKRILLSWHTYLLRKPPHQSTPLLQLTKIPPPTALLYVIWNNAIPQVAMGYWLKSFNKKPAPVPGIHFTVPEINNLPLVSEAIFIAMSLLWAWLSDGPLRGRRYPFIYLGAFITLIVSVLLRQTPLYSNIYQRKWMYWMSRLGNGAGPLILTWINEICSDDTEKRALLVGMGNDLAYVVQAVAPNFVWKTTDFPWARKGYLWSIVLQVLLGISTPFPPLDILLHKEMTNKPHPSPPNNNNPTPPPARLKKSSSPKPNPNPKRSLRNRRINIKHLANQNLAQHLSHRHEKAPQNGQ
ncbi:transporter protein [Venturia nashicola]|nr:transporter protein [Venturia nashicola]